MEQVYALFKDYEDAANAVQELTRRGYDSDKVSMIVNNEDDRLTHYTVDHDHDDDSDENATAFGAVVGTLTALGTSLIPGVGPVLVLGPAAGALVAGIGAATGAVTGAAVDAVLHDDIDETTAKAYAEIVQDGGAIVVVDTYDDWTEEVVEEILGDYSPVYVEDND